MTTIPPPIHTIASAIDSYHESVPDHPRPHLGASGLGHPCERWVWLSFRFAVKETIPGRVRRLFRRGHNEEEMVIADLKAIGCIISGTQNRIELAPHIGGSMDGIIESGLPGAEKTRHILEIKTHNKKSFNELEKTQSVKEAKTVHWCQMQLYMHGSSIDRALYAAVCKDDDRYYFERVKYDQEAAEKLVERGIRVVKSDRLPPPISTDPTWYQCRFCPARDFCHVSHKVKEVNCRTCAHSTACDDGQWYCARWDAPIPFEVQINGCGSHAIHPDLVPWKWVSGDGIRATYEIDGKFIVNGENETMTKDLI